MSQIPTTQAAATSSRQTQPGTSRSQQTPPPATPPRSVYRRIARRETHSPRSLSAIVIAILVILALAYLGTEIVLALLGAPALLVAPWDLFISAVDLVDAPVGVVAVAGILVAVIGLVLVVTAIAPGRRARHLLQADRTVVVVDNEVIASALARHASRAGDVDPDNTTVSVTHRAAEVRLTPTTGIPVDRAAVVEAVTEQLDSYGLKPPVRPRVHLSETGRIGA